MPISGTYAVMVRTPMGEQSGTFTVNATGDTFTGSISGDMGAMETRGGTVAGNTLTWQMDMKVPMPMTLDCTATIDGDTITGDVKAGVFGSMPLTGTRT